MQAETDYRLLKQLTEVYGPSTVEDGVIEIIRDALGDGYKSVVTGHKNLVIWKPQTAFKRTIVFQAHMDELGMRPYRYLSNGFIELTPTGGIPGNVTNHQITFHPGNVNGVLVIRNGEGNRKRFFADVGAADAEEALQMVPRHSNGAYARVALEESQTQLKGKSFDDRAGCAAIVEAIRAWDHAGDNRIIGVFTAREETGNWPVTELYRTMLDHSLAPDLIVNVECCPAEEIAGADDGYATVGKGIVLVHMDASYEPDPEICRIMAEIAERKKVVNQHMAVRAGSGELGRLALGFGVAGYPLTIPCRYMHHPHSVISKIDYQACIRMIREISQEFGRQDG
ncbi:MAG TPA: M20/M25/M40 family metallo-hydrolase [bacterium]|nr:M20/M25/M40 family metallo-hydrolase [bacterium]